MISDTFQERFSLRLFLVNSYPYIPESKSSHLAKYFKGKDPKEKVNLTTVKTRVKTCLEECTHSSLEPTYRVKTCVWKNVPG